MHETFCKVRLFVAMSDGSAIATDSRLFFKPPTTDEYEQLLYEEISFTDFTCYIWQEVQYIIAALDWFSQDGNHSTFSMTLNPYDVWPREFMTEEDED